MKEKQRSELTFCEIKLNIFHLKHTILISWLHWLAIVLY